LSSPPQAICILRLSALGDISHTLPVVRTLQKTWPDTRITWVIGRSEYELISDIPDIEFIIFDKKLGLKAYSQLYHKIHGRWFDILLHMQMSIRASLASLLIPADIRLGFDRARAKDLQWLFTNHKIATGEKQHVVDSFFGFTEALGISQHVLKWDIPIPEQDRIFAEQILARDKKILIISPCSSMSYRNWTVEGYAAVADYAAEQYDMQVVLSGGPTKIEREYADNISRLCRHKPLNLIGQTSIKQLLAILTKADVVIAPDSGPAHLATAVGTPVIGLYACTNPDRARPYLNPDLVVSRYPEAIMDKYGKTVDEVTWGTRVRDNGTMERITTDDVVAKLETLFPT
jgi:heptosyltransferase I